MASFTATVAVAVALLLACQASAEQGTEPEQGLTSENADEEIPSGDDVEGSEQSAPEIPPGYMPQSEYSGELWECYDYVIVGGGSAGSVVANRLSANNTYSVLVLEAGGEETPDLWVPFLAPFIKNENNTWPYITVPQKNSCLSFPGQMGVLTLGRILGGTSTINSMNYVRGSRHDFDRWEKEYGANGWGYDNVLEIFKEIENFSVSVGSEEERRKYHGFSGEIPINYASYNTQLSYSFLNACQEAGYQYVDYNGANHIGYSRVQSNTARGVRMSANMCFLQRVLREHKRLHISLRSVATKIVFDDEKRATHVEFVKNGEKKRVMVGREVIVSAGAIGSPQLLLLSGIGPKEELTKHCIEPVAELPVGQGLQDHIIFTGIVVNTAEDLIGLQNFNESMEEYRVNQTGLFTIPGAFETLLFTNSRNDMTNVKYATKQSELKDYPDIEVELIDLYPGPQIEKSPYVSRQVYEEYYMPMFNKTGFMAAVALVRPKSRGNVTLNSTDYAQIPLIDPNFFSEKEDLDRFVSGTLKFMEVFNTSAMRNISAEVWKGQYPSCKNYTAWTSEYVECFIKSAAFPGQHVCCTCAVGNHSRAVVDERLKVRGEVKNVRVVDASVMPEIPAGNTYASVMMIGAKAAHMILEDARMQTS